MALMEERSASRREGLSIRRATTFAWLPEDDRCRHLAAGAVIRDILHRLEDRLPPRAVCRCGCRAKARRTDRGGIRGFNALPEGGKIPRRMCDRSRRGVRWRIWVVNEEIVVRAEPEPMIPRSGGGHETDTHDRLAADKRGADTDRRRRMAVPVAAELFVEVSPSGGNGCCSADRKAARNELRAGAAGTLPAAGIARDHRASGWMAPQARCRAPEANTHAHFAASRMDQARSGVGGAGPGAQASNG